MERKNNYEIQAAQARALFCARDLDAVAREHGLRQEGQWLHLRLLGEPYRVSRRNGRIEREEDGRWLPADGFDETLTIFDLLCDAKPGRHAAGTWKTTLDFGGQVHRGLLENEKPDALELLYDKDPARLRAACETLGGEALPGADVSYALPFLRTSVSPSSSGTATKNSLPACASSGTPPPTNTCATRPCTTPSPSSAPDCRPWDDQ